MSSFRISMTAYKRHDVPADAMLEEDVLSACSITGHYRLH